MAGVKSGLGGGRDWGWSSAGITAGLGVGENKDRGWGRGQRLGGD